MRPARPPARRGEPRRSLRRSAPEVTAARARRAPPRGRPLRVRRPAPLRARARARSGLPVVPRRRAAPAGRRARRGDAALGRRRAARPPRAARAGAAQLAFLEAAFEAVRRGDADALTTAPVSKAQVARALPGFVGHTEWLEARCGVRRSVMMLAGERLKVALATNHVAFARLRRALTPARIAETIVLTHRAMRDDLGIARPRIALAALNPHAGEEGAFGDEERTLLRRGARARRPRRRARRRPVPGRLGLLPRRARRVRRGGRALPRPGAHPGEAPRRGRRRSRGERHARPAHRPDEPGPRRRLRHRRQGEGEPRVDDRGAPARGADRDRPARAPRPTRLAR